MLMGFELDTSNMWKQSTVGCNRKRRTRSSGSRRPVTPVNPADLMTKHLDGKRLMMLCDLLNVKRIGGRPSTAPKLTMDTEYISRASRALAAMTLVIQGAASEIGVPCGAEHEIWINGNRADHWTAIGWITVVIMTCCIFMGLVLLWWTFGGVAETIDSGTQTLEEGRCAQDIPTRIMITKHGKAAHCRPDCPFLLKPHVIQSLSWCSRCDPKQRFGKARLEAAHWVMSTNFEPQSVLYQFPVSQILVPQLYTRLSLLHSR